MAGERKEWGREGVGRKEGSLEGWASERAKIDQGKARKRVVLRAKKENEVERERENNRGARDKNGVAREKNGVAREKNGVAREKKEHRVVKAKKW